MSIKVTRIEDELIVSSQYNSNLPKRARAIGGNWDPTKKVWVFNISDEKLVKELYMDIYREWEMSKLIRVRITLRNKMFNTNDSVYICGKQIARATGRDSGAKTGEDIRWVSGELPTSGGSTKYWTTVVYEDSVFDIVKFPYDALEELSELANRRDFSFEVIEETNIDVTALIAERETLKKRIEEIDKLLGE